MHKLWYNWMLKQSVLSSIFSFLKPCADWKQIWLWLCCTKIQFCHQDMGNKVEWLHCSTVYLQSMWVERERPICCSVLKPIFVTPALHSAPALWPPAPAHTFSGMSAHCSIPVDPIFCPLCFISSLLSAHMCW